jgi:uncharacterized membrane protein YhaH (DUF805 family)
MPAYFDALANYFNFRGRLRRAPFFWFNLTAVGILLVAMWLTPGGDDAKLTTGTVVFGLHLFPLLTALVRRLHDMGKPAWFLLLLMFPIANVVFLLILFVRPSELLDDAEPQAAGPSASTLQELERLAELRQQGALTETEFQLLKSRMLPPNSAGDGL